MIYILMDFTESILNITAIEPFHYIYMFLAGKSATPFYYIVVLMQLVLLTPWILSITDKNNRSKMLLYVITPVYLFLVYIWCFTTGSQPPLYATLFPAWFGFYYLGLRVRNYNQNLECSVFVFAISLFINIAEAIAFRDFGFSVNFYVSQITAGSFFYSACMIGLILKANQARINPEQNDTTLFRIFAKIGDCSYGIFYIHMIVLKLVSLFITKIGGSISDLSSCLVLFLITAAVCFFIVSVTQRIFVNHRKFLRIIGFI